MELPIKKECKNLSRTLDKLLNKIDENGELYANKERIENNFNSIISYFSEGYIYNYMNNKDSQRIVHENIENLIEELDAINNYANKKTDFSDNVWNLQKQLHEFKKTITHL